MKAGAVFSLQKSCVEPPYMMKGRQQMNIEEGNGKSCSSKFIKLLRLLREGVIAQPFQESQSERKRNRGIAMLLSNFLSLQSPSLVGGLPTTGKRKDPCFLLCTPS